MRQSEDERKYQSLIKRFFIERLLKAVLREITENDAKKILSIGCGESYPERFLLDKLKYLKILGIDKNKIFLEVAKKRNPEVDYMVGDIYKLNFSENEFDIALGLEILEHLDKPELGIVQVRKVARKCIFSVPFEPWFSFLSFLSGSYLSRWGRHPGHLNFWNKKSFFNLLKRFFGNVEIKICFPWLLAVCEK